ncbi:MAG: 50S ribosomal protein L29 [Proteobacteria bacterium]|nr:50S ribosomal protein L29 [Pseudomonadota bacterium]
MKMEEIRSLNDEKLVDLLADLRKEQLNLKFQQASGQLEKPHRVADVRLAISQVKTEMTARKSQEATNNV